MPLNSFMDDYVTVPDVPVFDEHDNFDEEKLNEIIDNCNRRIEDTGDYAPITLGHTDPSLPEDQQPEIVGYATNFRLGTIGQVNPRKAILATFKLKKDRAEVLKDYPRRSVELWKKELFLDPIALLGANTPQRDLGLTSYQKSRQKKIRYEMTANNCNANTTYAGTDRSSLLKEVLEQLENSDVFQYVRNQMIKDTQKADAEDRAEMEQEEQAQKDQQALATQTAPAPDQTSEEEPDKERMQRDQLKFELERYRKEAADTRLQLETLKTKFRRAERERDLIRLESLGYSLDIADELDFVQDMEPEKYSKHLARIETKYQRAPIGVNVQPARVADYGGEQQFTKAQMDAAVKLAQGGMSYADAINKVKQG